MEESIKTVYVATELPDLTVRRARRFGRLLLERRELVFTMGSPCTPTARCARVSYLLFALDVGKLVNVS